MCSKIAVVFLLIIGFLGVAKGEDFTSDECGCEELADIGKKAAVDCKTIKKANCRTMNFTEKGKEYVCKQYVEKEHKLYTFYKAVDDNEDDDDDDPPGDSSILVDGLYYPTSLTSMKKCARKFPSKTKCKKDFMSLNLDFGDMNSVSDLMSDSPKKTNSINTESLLHQKKSASSIRHVSIPHNHNDTRSKLHRKSFNSKQMARRKNLVTTEKIQAKLSLLDWLKISPKGGKPVITPLIDTSQTGQSKAKRLGKYKSFENNGNKFVTKVKLMASTETNIIYSPKFQKVQLNSLSSKHSPSALKNDNEWRPTANIPPSTQESALQMTTAEDEDDSAVDDVEDFDYVGTVSDNLKQTHFYDFETTPNYDDDFTRTSKSLILDDELNNSEN